MSVGFDRKSKGTSKTKVSKFDVLTRRVHQQILRLQITMENSVLMQVDKRLQNLIQEALCLLLWQWLITVLLHVLLQVELEVLEDEEKLVLRIDDLLQPNDK